MKRPGISWEKQQEIVIKVTSDWIERQKSIKEV